MSAVIMIANYIANWYFQKFHKRISEMTLHKLMYFSQRESIILNGRPLFDDIFHGWKYGPVLKEVRTEYGLGHFNGHHVVVLPFEDELAIASALERYGYKDSWSLSRLSHGELSWKNSRKGISEEANSDNPINILDIYKDAERIKLRRTKLGRMK